MSKKLNTAVIGAGNMGRHHARIYSTISNLVAIADVNQKIGKTLAKKHDAVFYPDFKAMLKNESIDAVSVVVPTKFHYKVAKYCLNHKIATLVEKPITQTVVQAEKLLSLASANKTYFQHQALLI